MLLDAEILLMAMVTGLYLFDSALLLYTNEGLIGPGARGRWRVAFGSMAMRLMGRGLHVLHPLLPYRPVFRLQWQLPAGTPGTEGEWAARAALFRPLALRVAGVALALFVLLPVGLFARWEAMLVAALLALYGSIIAALWWVGLRKKEFGLSTGRFWLLAFELLVCPPFALNLVRRLSVDMPLGEDLIAAARRLQSPLGWSETRQQVLARLDEEIDGEEEDAARMALLQDFRRRLAEEDSCPA